MKNTYVILIDWGSTNLRAWLCDPKGKIYEQISTGQGIAQIEQQDIPGVMDAIVNNWSHYYQGLPVRLLMSGMIGSERGLGNAPYLTCPLAMERLHPVRSIISTEHRQVHIIPGICSEDEDNYNVIRGEETQLIGAWRKTGARFYVMPGTHSKWAEVGGGVIRRFHTAITGELYQLLMQHSLIGKGLPPQCQDWEAFKQGVTRGLADRRLLGSLFEVRAGYLLHQMPREGVGDYLSGLLIGNEIQQLSALYPLAAGEVVTVIAGDNLARRYCAALDLAAIPCRPLDGEEAVLIGMRSFIDELA
ncbi:2-dehydro-3-deoxygalactonokinase [Acerihabitans sp. KWT182]|uniref:2-dehydro-3-deoxygalactonokinase n=1 Tax=Acerihabitans sp. KWT182 TaxID=3157919 RepID=A0AAU7QBS6_9GAMM